MVDLYSSCKYLIQDLNFVRPIQINLKKAATRTSKDKSQMENLLADAQKDFENAKITFNHISKRKWNSALKASKKVKDREFRNLVTWLYLKQLNWLK